MVSAPQKIESPQESLKAHNGLYNANKGIVPIDYIIHWLFDNHCTTFI